MAVVEFFTCALASVRRQADRVVSPDTRAKALQSTHDFALEQPLLFSFLVVQSLFALVPVLLFTSFALGVICLACVTALLFSLFWVGLAVLVLGSALFVTSTVAVLAWLWVVAAYVAASFVYGLVISKRDGAASDTTNEAKLQGKRDQIFKKESYEINGKTVNGDQDHKDGEH